MNKKTEGMVYIILASSAFGIMPILAKLAYRGGATVYVVLFLRFFLASIMLLYYLIRNKISLKLKRKQYIILIILGIVGYSFSSMSTFISYNYISVGLTTMLVYTYPIIVTILAVILYKEKIHKAKIVSLCISLFGLYILINTGGSALNLYGIIFALLAAFFYSFYVVGISHSEVKQINSFVLTFYISVTSSCVMLLMGVSLNSFRFNISFYSIVSIILLSFISTVVALMAFLKGVRIIGPSNASILSTVEPIVSILLGVLILKEKFTANLLFGGILVILSIYILVKGDKIGR